MASYANALLLVSVFLFFTSSLGIPVQKPTGGDKPTRKDALNANIVGLDEEEYKRYVEEIRRLNAKRFEELKDKTPEEAVRTVDRKISYTEEDIRSRMEEAKRQVVDQLRALGRLRQLRDEKLPISDQELQALRLQGVSKDITTEDLDKLMHEKVQVLQALDARRKDMFKQHEMGIEAKRREKLKKMTERDRLKAEEEFRKEAEARKAHHVPHPGGKEQLQDVWEKEDEMDREDFEPKSFFLMHDTNNDRFLDPIELEALFFKEVKDIYGDDRDQTEIREEMARMREHVLEEIDANQDGMISMEEFLKYTEGPHFEDKDWEGIDNVDEIFSDEEFEDYMQDYANYDYHDGGVDDMGDEDHPQEGDSEGIAHHPNPAEGTHQGGIPAEQPHQPEVNHQGETPHPQQQELNHQRETPHPQQQEVNHQGETPHPQQQEVNHQGGTPEEHAQEQEPTQVHEQEEPSHGGASDPTEGQPSVDTASPNSKSHEEPTVNAEHHEQQQQQQQQVM